MLAEKIIGRGFTQIYADKEQSAFIRVHLRPKTFWLRLEAAL